MSQRYACWAHWTPAPGTPFTLAVASKSMFHRYGTTPPEKRDRVPAAPNSKPMSLLPPMNGNAAGS